MGSKINKISIIIVTWNTVDITLRCIQTIKKHLNNVEIIVVDNNSQDRTIEVLSKEKDIILVKNNSNLGFSKANNIGLKHASNDLIIFMNSDIELIDDSIKKMVDYFNTNLNIGIIGPQFLNIDLTPQASVFPKQNAVNAFKEFYLKKKNSYLKYIPDSSTPLSVWAISGGCLLTRKSFFESIGGWNEKYFFYFEDMDLCREVHKKGMKVVFYPECKVIHRHGASGNKIAPQKDQWHRLIPGSKKYHGLISHYFINFIIWSGQKFQKVLSLFAD
jgi:GT2 family glycosyltransferase